MTHKIISLKKFNSQQNYAEGMLIPNIDLKYKSSNFWKDRLIILVESDAKTM